MDCSREAYFQRQTMVSEFGEKGQERLGKTKVLIIGCGGLGSPAAIYLATSGVGAIHLVDFDKVSVSNLHRQIFYNLDDVGKLKVEVLAARIAKKTPFCKVSYSSIPLAKDNAESLIGDYDIVLDGTDHLPTKYLINDVCVLLGKPLVYGSLYKFDGYVASFNVKNKEGIFSCNLRDAFPEISSDVPNCEEAGTLNPIVGMIALMQANEVLKIASGVGEPLVNQITIFNSLKNSQFNMKLNRSERNVRKLIEETSYESVLCSHQNKKWLISSEVLKESEQDFIIINLSNSDRATIPFNRVKTILYKDFKVEKLQPTLDKKYVFVCNKGITSYTILEKVKKVYPELKAYSLTGGLENY